MRTQVKSVRAAIAAKDKAAAKTALLEATVSLDKAASKGVVPEGCLADGVAA